MKKWVFAILLLLLFWSARFSVHASQEYLAQSTGQWMTPPPAPSTSPDAATPLPDSANSGFTPYNDPPVEPAFLIIPVIVDQVQQKAFSDLPVIVSSALANKLSQQAQKQKYVVMNPYYVTDEIHQRSLDGLYEKIMRDYIQAGQPNEEDLTYLTDHLATKTRQVKWVMFVQTDFETTIPSYEGNVLKRFVNAVNGDLPAEAHYPIHTRAQIYTTDNGVPHVWTGRADTTVAMDRFGQFTKSVYTDNNINFRGAAETIANQLIFHMPEIKADTTQAVNASLAPQLPQSLPANLTPDDQNALKRSLGAPDTSSSLPIPQ